MEENQLNNSVNGENELISTWGYVGIILLLAIPMIGPIFAIVWACGGCKKKSKTNFARASLIIGTISLIFTILIGFAVKSVVTGVIEKVETFSALSKDFEDVESLLGEDAPILDNMEGLSELEGLEELGDLESLLGSEGLDSLESMIDMDSLGDLQNLDESDIMGIINNLDEEDLENITQMIESLGQYIE